MRGLRFLDFDLMFQRVEKGYLAKVLGSPAGQASLEFSLPFSEMEIENFLLRFGRSRQPVRRLGATQIEAARSFGGRLFEAAFQGEVRSCLRSSLDEAQRQDLGLRLRLRLAEAPELNDLPWEFLLHPALGRFLALSTETPLVRYIDLPERVRPLAVKPPLEILAVISSPEDYPALDVEEEWRQLQVSLAELQARGLLRLSRLESPTLSDLQRFLRRQTCHILHFIGHGGFDPRTEDGLLLFTDGKGRGREVSGAALGTLLHDHRPLRLAVLNACEGARASRTDPFAGVAQALVREGIPAVVAMQFEITDRAAIEFAHEIYSAVVDGFPIDAALGEARKALFFAGHELAWGTPVLYMRSPDGQLFDLDVAALPATLGRVDRGSVTLSAAEPTLEVARVEGESLTLQEAGTLPGVEETVSEKSLAEAGPFEPTAEVASFGVESVEARGPKRRVWSYGYLLALAVVVSLLLLAVAAFLSDGRHKSLDPKGTSPAAAAAEVPLVPVPNSPVTVSLYFLSDCWVEALIDGKQRLSELRVQGETLQLDAKKSVSLTLGNARAVDIQVNGRTFDLDRKEGDVVRDLVIDLETLKALKEKRGNAAP